MIESYYPLVSIGVPTFNRPDGLKRTLECLTRQTYPNLEIIVSDNSSSDPLVREVVEKFIQQDGRIQYFCQDINHGPTFNFKFVFERSVGDYFMWAADDDEWDPLFIETCLANTRESCSVMTGFDTVFRKLDKVEINPVPFLSPNKSPFENFLTFIKCMQPSLIYGLHKRTSLLFFLDISPFDFYDCYFVLRLILTSGFHTIPDKILYHAGVDADSYVIKRTGGDKVRLKYSPFLTNSISLIFNSNILSTFEKIVLSIRIAQVTYQLYIHHKDS